MFKNVDHVENYSDKTAKKKQDEKLQGLCSLKSPRMLISCRRFSILVLYRLVDPFTTPSNDGYVAAYAY
jgi:hypothetical protein